MNYLTLEQTENPLYFQHLIKKVCVGTGCKRKLPDSKLKDKEYINFTQEQAEDYYATRGNYCYDCIEKAHKNWGGQVSKMVKALRSAFKS